MIRLSAVSTTIIPGQACMTIFPPRRRTFSYNFGAAARVAIARLRG